MGFLPSVIVMMDGGLGSQMWQYALGRAVQENSGLPVMYDLSWFKKNGKDINGRFSRRFELTDVFPGITLKQVSESASLFYKIHCQTKPGAHFDYNEELLSSAKSRYLGGYYVNQKYIDQQGDALRALFSFHLNLSDPNKGILSQIKTEAIPVAVHIRRGDYVGSVLDVVSANYYRECIKMMSDRIFPRKASFFVFSNGLNWARQALSGIDEKIIFVDVNNNDSGACDLFLMSQCSHFIIANSSFSWWGAWLSRKDPNKIVPSTMICDSYS